MKIGGRSPPFPDAELIRAMAALLTETGLTEIEYALGDRRIRVARTAGGPAPLGASSAPSAAGGSIEHPGAVTEGQPLLIIEAMKVMNQIRAHRPGRLAQILVADAQPVEYGAVLMLIE